MTALAALWHDVARTVAAVIEQLAEWARATFDALADLARQHPQLLGERPPAPHAGSPLPWLDGRRRNR